MACFRCSLVPPAGIGSSAGAFGHVSFGRLRRVFSFRRINWLRCDTHRHPPTPTRTRTHSQLQDSTYAASSNHSHRLEGRKVGSTIFTFAATLRALQVLWQFFITFPVRVMARMNDVATCRILVSLRFGFHFAKLDFALFALALRKLLPH